LEEATGGGWGAAGWVTLWTAVGIGVMGYHPYSEDGGIYFAEVRHRLDPGLYPHGTEFVTGHLGPTFFSDAVACMVRASGLSLATVVLALYVVCLWGMLLGVWLLAARCYRTRTARVGAVAVVALLWTVPVAGTSLLLMDPYVTARSASTALTLLGLSALLDFLRGERWKLGLVAGCFGLALVLHPLMAGYGLIEAFLLVCWMDGRRWVVECGVVGTALLTMAAAGVAQRMAAVETADYLRVAATRYYWFLSQWQWYEWVGLVAPMAILGWVGWRGRGGNEAERGLARMAVSVGGIAVLVAGLFAREAAKVHLVARMQPLRCFQMIYVVMLMVLGAALGEWVLRRSIWRWGAAAMVLGGSMFFVQRQTYPASDHLELPGMTVRNRWEQAFRWAGENTPRDALFALDADYIHEAGEDSQGFRAIAGRSVLPDYSKDGGQASIRPELTPAWVMGQRAQAGLSRETDGDRLAALHGLGATWVVLERGSVTRFDCPYENERVKVCRMASP
jgi:hypothetical protein